jgi:PilZ domain
MSPKSQLREDQRAPRAKLGGSVLALVLLENGRQVRAKIHQLSANGGMLNLEKPLDEGIRVKILFYAGSVFRIKAQLLFPMWATNGFLQPFRFNDLSQEDRERLDEQVQKLLVPQT